MRQSGLFNKNFVKPKAKKTAKKKQPVGQPLQGRKQATLGFAKPKVVIMEEQNSFVNKYRRQSKKNIQREYRKKLEAAVRDLSCHCRCHNCRGRMKVVMGVTEPYIDDCEECFGRVTFGEEVSFTDEDDRAICETLNKYGPPWRRTTGDKWPNQSLVMLNKNLPQKAEAAMLAHVEANFSTTYSDKAVHLPHNYRGWYRKQYQI